MDEVKRKLAHKIVMTEREELNVNGVIDVVSFDEELIIVDTSEGILEIRGEGLHVNQLNLDDGELNLNGQISSLEYEDKMTFSKGKESLISRLFS